MRFLSFLLLFTSLLFSASLKITTTMSMQELNKLTAYDGAADDHFGYSVAMSGDTVVVGAYLDDDSGTDSGSAHIYERDTATGLFHQTAKLTASDGVDYAYFGYSVAISGDSVVVGAYIDDASGSTYIYERDTATGFFHQTAKLTASDGVDYAYFGCSVAISGDSVVVGAWGDDDSGEYSGSAYIYEKPGSGWADSNQESTKLIAFDGADRDYFGYSVGISGDSVVVGAYGDDDLGASSGSVYLYEKPDSSWVNITQGVKLTASDGEADDKFGISVAISGDSVVVGAHQDEDSGASSGSAYIYEKPGTGWADSNQESAKLTASDGADYDKFGISVGISGESVAVGAYYDDDSGFSSGSVYIYEKPGTGWADSNQESTKLIAYDGAVRDYFGYSVGISGESVVVGAWGDDDSGEYSGSAYVFKAKPSGVNPAIIMYLLN